MSAVLPPLSVSGEWYGRNRPCTLSARQHPKSVTTRRGQLLSPSEKSSRMLSLFRSLQENKMGMTKNHVHFMPPVYSIPKTWS